MRTYMLTVHPVPLTRGDATELLHRPELLIDVISEVGERLGVRVGGQDAWIPKACAVPLERADDFWTDRLMLNPLDAHAWKARGLARAALGHAAGALDDFAEALRLSPNDVVLLGKRAALALAERQFDRAKADIDRLLRLEAGHPDALLLRGTWCQQTGNPRRAVADITEALKGRAPCASAYRVRAEAWAALDQPGRSADDYAAAVKLAPDDANLRVARAAARARLGDLTGAHEDLERATLHANDPATLSAIAWLLATHPNADLRDGARAVELAGRAAELAGWPPALRATFACACAEAGDFAQARDHIALALADATLSPASRGVCERQQQAFALGEAYRA